MVKTLRGIVRSVISKKDYIAKNKQTAREGKQGKTFVN